MTTVDGSVLRCVFSLYNRRAKQVFVGVNGAGQYTHLVCVSGWQNPRYGLFIYSVGMGSRSGMSCFGCTGLYKGLLTVCHGK